LYAGALKGMLEALEDPYSVYMPKDEWRSLKDTTVGSFGGVGLSITKPTENKPDKPAYVEVSQPIEDSPGYKAGIQAGDLIVAIDGTDTSTITMNEVLDKLRGTVGTTVTVKIKRGKTMEFERILTRAVIENPTVKSGMIENSKIGYIKITEFSSNTAPRVQEAINKFVGERYNGLIIDLRNNGGGLLSSAVDIAEKFIDSGIIVSTKSRISYENSVYTAHRGKTTVRGIPVVVLINGASASASEILAGALKDTHVAYLVGEKTYGKGSVQIPSELVNNDGFKITVARYYSPSDTNIDKIGIPPDREVKFPEFTEEEEKAYVNLVSAEEIEAYVETHPNMTEEQIAAYAETLYLAYPIDKRVIRKIVRNEVDRTRPSRLYDLDYDLQLNEAIKILKNEDMDKLMKSTKTLKQLQAEVKAETETEK
ncbi:MAG: S41 family peptidase, partial [Treponema sp.]|nr:S41 family peptidase [Treponema sp.]